MSDRQNYIRQPPANSSLYASLAIPVSHGQVSGGDTIDYSGGIPVVRTSIYINGWKCDYIM